MKTPKGGLTAIFFSVMMAALLSGCAERRDVIKDATLPSIANVDEIKVRDRLSEPIGIKDITDKQQISRLTAFVSALPGRWTVPWYGSPVGQVYFYFYKDGTCVGNFYVGCSFFGRNANYRDGLYDFFSQPATKTQIHELGQIAGFDVWKYSHVDTFSARAKDTKFSTRQ